MANGSFSSQVESDLILSQITLLLRVTTEPKTLCTQLSLATRMEYWTSLGQHKRKPEFPVVIREFHLNLRKTTWFPLHCKMRPLPAPASQE